MKIVSWNVNSIRTRLATVVEWVAAHNPDILLLQEIKCETHAFPYESFENYNVVVHGQKSYHGVAILSRFPLEDVVEGLPTLTNDTQARYIEALVNAPQGVVRVASVYVPNGGKIGSEKYAYKLKFLSHFRARLQQLLELEEKAVVGGDYNIAPFDLDVHDPAAWHEQILCSTPERLALQAIFHLGYYDGLRVLYPGQGGLFSWWDYRQGAWPKDEGLRIDHLLLSPLAVDCLATAGLAKEERGKEKASDHVPVWCQLKERSDLWHSPLKI